MSQAHPTRGRRFSYSLRSLFVLIALVAIGMGWVAYQRRQSQREAEIAEQLKELGASVQFGGVFDPMQPDVLRDPSTDQPWWRRAMSGVCGPRIRSVVFEDPDKPKSFADLALLADLSNILILELEGTEIADLSPIARLSSLRFLSIQLTPVSDLSPIANLKNLDGLVIHGAPVRDLSPLAGLKNLTALYAGDTFVSDLSPLAGLTKLEILDVGFGDASPAQNAHMISDLSPLAGLTQLRMLHVDLTEVSDLSPLSGLQELHTLSLVRCPHIADLSPIAGLKNLTQLLASETMVSDLAPLAGFANLVYLNLNWSPVRDLSPVLGHKSLQRLYIQHIQAPEQQVHVLMRSLPNCQVFTDLPPPPLEEVEN